MSPAVLVLEYAARAYLATAWAIVATLAGVAGVVCWGTARMVRVIVGGNP